MALAIIFSSCASYKQNIMFRVSDQDAIRKQVSDAETNYLIRKNDALELEVFTNRGERILDPNFEKTTDLGGVGSAQQAPKTYVVDPRGLVRFPLIDEIKVEGLTLHQAEQLLQQEYAKFYKEPYVIVRFTNKRVVVLGAPGGRVIPLLNEQMRLTEVLALAEGLDENAKSHNIRVLRDKEVFVVDFSTIDGYLRNDMMIQPGDIIYVEPVRRPFSEGLRDSGPILSLVTSIGTLIIVILQSNR